MLLGDLEGEPTPTYDQVFGLSDPTRDEMRQGFDEIGQTPVPFLVSLVNEEDSADDGMSFGPFCSLCHREH